MAHSLETGVVSRWRPVGERGMLPRELLAPHPRVDVPALVKPAQESPPAPVLTCKDADNAIRWKEGERLDHLFEQSCDRFAPQQAIASADESLSYRELDNRANRLARYLSDQGITSGDRVGLLFDKTVDTYVALLAVLKLNAGYVPFDVGFPNERIRFILQDAGVKAVVSMSNFRDKLSEFDVTQIFLDVAQRDIARKDAARLADHEKAPPVEQLCYIIYTSGTTGNPKGVVIEHPSICNFVRVAAGLYGVRPGDRVYQGMTIAFDFSVEEVWVPLMAGATLVPGKPGISLIGDELADFLVAQRVTVVCCAPTLLATIEKDVPELRILVVGGEACPHHLVVRWHRPGRTILNTYGPTEATVTASLAVLTPDKPVTIGRPLPTYAMAILDPHKDEAVARGKLGEIGIAGIGLAAGYLNRAELTQTKFIPDFLNIPDNPSKRIYRTGDLGRINDQDEVEYHGRIDTQVKIRGYRIELTEIESVLMQLPQIAQAAVGTYEEAGAVELVAYYTLRQGAADLSHCELSRALRSRLPAYMVPAYVELLPALPMLISNKADRKKLPAPKGPRLSGGSNNFVAPRTEREDVLARALAEVLKVERVSVEDNFFQDMGAHSLLMARFCAKIRQDLALSDVSMRDVYLNPTIAKLAGHLGSASAASAAPARPQPVRIPSNLEYYGCGALQLLAYVGYGLLGLWILDTGFEWAFAAVDNAAELYLRSTAFAVGAFAVLSAIPIAAKWLLIGKWKEATFPVWSLRYFRFWVVKTLIQTTPMAAFAGSPIFNVYLRLLGAKIGRNTVIKARFIPVCTDLISIGDNTILRKDSILLGYKAQSNYIHTGPITIGDNAFVGEASVLDINTAMGDRSQLGHASSLQSGQRVPDGKHYHGSPAQETTAEYCPIEAKHCSALRRAIYSAVQLIGLFAILTPIPVVLLSYVESAELGHQASGWAVLSLTLLVSLPVFFGTLAAGLLGVYAVPRLCHRFLKADRTYVMYGFHYWLQGVITTTSNSRIYNLMFGDTSFIINYLRFVGWSLNKVEQTGSNFGTNQRHDNPFLCDIGSGTMVSDGLSMINVQMSNTSFKLGKTRIGERNYLGNDIHYPPDGRTGANCLLATKVMIPVDGPVRENVGLLGSPCFEIPRMVERDKNFINFPNEEARQQRIRQKNVHNLVTLAAFLLSNWLFFAVTLFFGHVGLVFYSQYGVLSLLVAAGLVSLTAIAYFAFLERATLRFRRLEPKIVSIYDQYFWFHERHWKLSDSPITSLFKGTPFKNVISRLLGVKLGRKVFDDGAYQTERTLVTIGDYANLNEACVLQGHSLEEGVFKSDYIKIGDGCSVGVGAFVHYGVTMGDNVVLDADSFLMKGEVLDPNTIWRGNPANMVRSAAADGTATQPDRSQTLVMAAAA